MLVGIFLLPLFSYKDYSIIKNTTSQLGAQNTPNAWVMNLPFIGLGLSVIYQGINKLKRYYFQQFIILIFGISFILTGIYRHAPIDSSLSYNGYHDMLHSFFATSTGFAFTLFAFSLSFIQKIKRQRVLSILIAIVATILSILMFYLPQLAGIWQRGIFILSFAWFLYIFEQKYN